MAGIGRIRDADTAAVAQRRDVRPGLGVVHRLRPLAALRAGAAGGNHRHEAGVEIGAQGRRNGAVVDLLGGVELEGEILLDDPLVVGNGGLGHRVLHRHFQAAARIEGDRRSDDIAGRALRIHRLVAERTGVAAGARRNEGAVAVERDARVERAGSARRQRIAGRVGVVGEHTGRDDFEQRGNVAGVGIGHRLRCAAHGGGLERHGGAGGVWRGHAIAAILEGGGCRAGVGEEAVQGEARARRGRADHDRARNADVIAQHVGGEGLGRGGADRDDVVVSHGVDRDVRIQHSAGGLAGTRADRTAVDDDQPLHAAVALVVVGQAQLSIEHGVDRGGVGAGAGRGMDHEVVDLACRHEPVALQLGAWGEALAQCQRHVRRDIAVFGDQRHRQSDRGRHMHAQPGIHHAQQHVAARGRRRDIRRRLVGM